MPILPSQKNNLPNYSSKFKSYSNQDHPKKNYRKNRTHKYKSQYPTKPHKKEIKCLKCGKIRHIAPNCRRQKIIVISDLDKDYYFEENTSSSFDISQNENLIPEKEKSLTDKIENCLCQLNISIIKDY